MKPTLLAVTFATALAAPALAQHEHHAEMMLGWELATNRLHVHSHGVAMPYPLPPSPFAGVNGWAEADVAFTSSETPHPALGTEVLPASVDIRAVLIASSPGISVFGPGGPLPIGGELPLGAPVIHFMPVWNITVTDPGEIKSMTFVFHDASGQLADSLPFTTTFTTVPAPGAAMAIGCGLLAATRRRRRQ